MTIDELDLQLEADSSEAEKALNKTINLLGNLESAISSIETSTSKISELTKSFRELSKAAIPKQVFNDIKKASQAFQFTPEIKIPKVDLSETVSSLKQAVSAVDLTKQEFFEIPQAARDVAEKIKQAVTNAGAAIGGLSRKFKELLPNTQKNTISFGRFSDILKRVVIYRMVRKVISEAIAGMRDGIRNLARYSNEFNASMSQLSTGSLYLKNSLGAMLGPVIQSLMPIFQSFVNVVVQAANAVNQFLAAISGRSVFIKAKEFTVDYANSLGGATKAAKDLKNAVSSIDELNIISPQDSGAAGGLDYAQMFEEAEVDSKISAIADKVRPLIDYIKNNLSNILDIAVGIGAAFLTWKVAKGLLDGIQLIRSLSKAGQITLGLSLAIAGIVMEFTGIKDAIENGLNAINFAEIIAGGSMITVGGALIGKALGSAILGGAIGAIGAGTAAFVTGIYDALKNGIDWLSAIAVGATAVGAGIGAIVGLAGGPIGAGIGALVGLAVGLLTDLTIWIVQNWKTVKEFFVNIGNSISEFFTQTIPQKFGEFVNWLGEIPNKIAYFLGFVVGSLVKFATVDVPKFLTDVGNWFMQLPSKIWEGLKAALAKLSEWGTQAISWVTTEVPKIIDNIVDWFKKLPDRLYQLGTDILQGLFNGIKNAFEGTKNFFSGIADNFVKGFKEAFGIHSPSKLMEPLGVNVSAGIGVGVEGGSKGVLSSIGDMAKGVMATLTNALGVGNNQSTSSKATGTALMAGMAEGICSGQVGVLKVMRIAAEALLEQLNLSFGISAGHSTKTKSIGEILMSSLSRGLQDNFPEASKILKELCEGLLNVMGNTLGITDNTSLHMHDFGRIIMQSLGHGISDFAGVAKDALRGVLSELSYMLDDFLDDLNRKLSRAESKISSASEKASAASNRSFKSSVDTLMAPVLNIQGYAKGGFVKSANIFATHENGIPEMVGRIGNRTAVANNDQMVQMVTEGVAEGVYEAFVAAMAQSGNSNQPIEVVVNLDGREVARGVENGKRQLGYAIAPIGAH